jgi:hypothetical protein
MSKLTPEEAKFGFLCGLGYESLRKYYPDPMRVPEWFSRLHEKIDGDTERAVNETIGVYGEAWREMYAKRFSQALAAAVAKRRKTPLPRESAEQQPWD